MADYEVDCLTVVDFLMSTDISVNYVDDDFVFL